MPAINLNWIKDSLTSLHEYLTNLGHIYTAGILSQLYVIHTLSISICIVEEAVLPNVNQLCAQYLPPKKKDFF